MVAAARASAADHGFLGILGRRMVIEDPFGQAVRRERGDPPGWSWYCLFLKQLRNYPVSDCSKALKGVKILAMRLTVC